MQVQVTADATIRLFFILFGNVVKKRTFLNAVKSHSPNRGKSEMVVSAFSIPLNAVPIIDKVGILIINISIIKVI